jgi:hypothetical protein
MEQINYGFKKSSIRRALHNKISDWLKSITDETLAEEMAKGIIVTGGAIPSMLLGEKVRDYDIYFKTIELAEKVANYYVNEFNLTTKQAIADGAKPDAIPVTPEIRRTKVVNCKGEEEERIMIFIKSAGVAAESTSPYRYFEQLHPDKAEEFIDTLAKSKKDKRPYRPVFMSQNAITLSDGVQVIIRFFGDAAGIHRNFDYVHALSWYDYYNNHLELNQKSLECLLSRTLMYSGSLYPVASIFRAKKFIERGWRISAGQLLKIMWQLSELKLSDPQTLHEQLTGVDAHDMMQLVNALKDTDPDKITGAYVAELIDRIFD